MAQSQYESEPRRRPARFGAKIVAYADDYVIYCRGNAGQAMAEMRRLMTQLKLTVNDTKTHIRWHPAFGQGIRPSLSGCYEQSTAVARAPGFREGTRTRSGVLLCWQPCACYTATGVAQAESSDRSPDTPCGPDPGCSIVRLADQHAIELFHHRFGIQPQNPSFGRLSDVTDHALDCGRQACPV